VSRVAVAIGVGIVLSRGHSSTRSTRSVSTSPVVGKAPPPPPEIARLVLEFGEAGTNAGQLTGARALAVAPSGEIVIAEVDTGRVQVFDASGAYLRVINIPTKSVSIHGVGVDDHGHAIVARDCDLVVLDLAAGKVIKIVRGSYPERCYAADLHVAPDGRAATDAIGSRRSSRRFAIDGIGRIYLIKQLHHAVEIRDAKGTIQRKFSQGNPARGQLAHLDAIAIDGKSTCSYRTATTS
jgi:hypothetical protein